MVKCGWPKCDIEFDETTPSPGHKRKYCCNEHKKYAGWERVDERKIKARLELKKKREAARIYAAINCLNYTSCICNTAINCLNCESAETVKDAFRHEPGILVHDQSGEHGPNL